MRPRFELKTLKRTLKFALNLHNAKNQRQASHNWSRAVSIRVYFSSLLVAQQVQPNLVGRAGVADDARENYLNCHVNLATLLPQLSPGPGAVYGAAPEIPLYFPLPPISV
ncbi:hypothetical protein SAMN05446935_6537 [Burkholderia sp. YR290]|nr:hypothetical protein SAMN05446935_6537 [Burkholderia sp. YR290]